MAEQQIIKYAPQWNNMSVDNVLDENYSSTEQVNSIQQLLAYCLITETEVDIGEIIYSDLVTKLLNKSRLKYISYLRFILRALQVLLGSDYTQDENFGFLPGIPSNSNFTKDPSKVTNIELTAHMIAINNQKDLVSPLPLAAKPKKRKSQTVTLTFPKSQGPEVLGALSNKIKSLISLGTVLDPQDLERDIQLASTRLPSTLDEGTRKSKPLRESTTNHPKDLVGNKQPLDRDITSTTSDEGMTKTTAHPEGSLGDKDSWGNIPPADKEPSLPENEGKPSHEGELDTQPIVLSTYADVRDFLLSDDESEEDILGADSDSSSDDILRKYDNTIPLTERQLEKHEEVAVNYVDLKASIDDYYDENIAHQDQTDKLVEASMSSFDKSINTISDLYKGLNIAHALKQNEELVAWAKSSTNMAWNPGSRLLGLERAQNHIQSSISQAVPKHDEGKGIATESDEDLSKRLVPASTIIHPDLDTLIFYTINEEARLLAISKPEVIKVVQKEAKKIRLNPRKIASAKAGEKLKKAQDAEHQVLKREHTEKVSKDFELRKHKFKSYMWTINNKLKPETITNIKIHPKTKPVVITVYRDGRNFDVHRPFAFGAFGISELDELREIIPKKKNAVVHDLMNSLSQRYERIRKILEELRIKSALLASASEQASSQSSRKKRKHMELEPETKILGLECN
ncbi:hypothetical protein Tco_0990440 [Tanacetum coccineum]|uniref:Uncharacterized protein n=1 Tax=Tanacetum coccineum TaxID=301880 RepID=A0ABQ5EWJ9_9ASTR